MTNLKILAMVVVTMLTYLSGASPKAVQMSALNIDL